MSSLNFLWSTKMTLALNPAKTIHLNKSKKYYRKLDNDTLRAKIPGEESVTAKDIWLDALTCSDGWLFTTKNIAQRWDIPLKRARNKLSLLSKSGYAEAQKIIDPKNGKILLHYWIFHETPVPQKRGSGENSVNNCNIKENDDINHCPKNGAVVPIKNKHIKEKKQSNPPPLSGADLVTSLLTIEQRKTIDRALVNSIGKYIPCDQIPALIANAFQTDFPINYLWGAIRKARQSLTKPPSIQNPPPNPQKSLAFKEQEKYNQDLKEYSDQDMFMQQGQRQEPRKEPSQASRRLMERMNNFAESL